MKLLPKFLALGVAVAVLPAQADTIYGLYADANYWHTSTETTENGVKRDYEDKGRLMAAASLEHGVPFIPNVRVRYADLGSKSQDALATEIDATSLDAVAYYELLDNVVSVDLGLGAKRIEGDVRTAGTVNYELSKTLPMAYASVGGKLPFTGLSAKAELGVAIGTNVKATDAQAEIKYNFVDTPLLDIGGKLGYRALSLDYDEMNIKHLGAVFGEQVLYKADFKGPYVGVELHF